MRAGRRFLTVIAVLAATLSACGLDNPGVDAPTGTLNFPIAVALSPPSSGGPSRELFVVGSNFDLRFNAGNVMAFDLDAVEARFDAERAAGNSEPFAIDDATPLLVSGGGEVRIGSYAAGIAVSPSGRRLYVPVRSDGDLTFVDVDESGRMSCGTNGGAAPRCDDFHSRGDDSFANDRGIVLPAEPVGLTAGSLESDFGGAPGSGDYVLVADRAGRVSLFLDRAATAGTVAPMLVHVGTGFANGVAGISFDPRSGLVFLPGSGTNEIGRAGVALDTGGDMLERSFVFAAGSLRLVGLSDGQDSRAIAFEPSGPGAAHRAFVASRRPEALLVIDLDREGANPGEAAVSRVIEVGAGPARVTAARFGTPARTFVFVSCFDGRELYVVDADNGELASVVRGLSGPFELAVDPVRGRLYVGDFRSSVVRVIDVSELPMNGPAHLLATLGKPRTGETLQ